MRNHEVEYKVCPCRLGPCLCDRVTYYQAPRLHVSTLPTKEDLVRARRKKYPLMEHSSATDDHFIHELSDLTGYRYLK